MVPQRSTGGSDGSTVGVPSVPETAVKQRGTLLKKLKIIFLPLLFLTVILIGKEKILEAPELSANPILYMSPETELRSPGEIKIRSKAEKRLSEMTLEEKVGQMFIIPPEDIDQDYSKYPYNGKKTGGTAVMNDSFREKLKYYSPGGILLFSPNIVDPEQTTQLIRDMQKESSVPMFIAVDEEGGAVARISGKKAFDIPDLPNAEQVKDEDEAYERGRYIGSYLKKYGFNCDFAPVADLNTNPSNRVIGKRAFGKDPEKVGDLVASEIRGFQQNSIITATKHFPGHGDTRGDTHNSAVYVTKNWQELLDCEIIPFQRAMEAGTDMIMVAHISAEEVTHDGVPASLSRTMITGKLRNELGFQGVVVTDSMEMGAIYGNYTSVEAAIMTIEAGADIVLMPPDFVAAYNGLLDAVQTGRIPEARIDESVLRILELKEKYGLLE